MRYAPLDWWRCEKVVYGRRESGEQYVPTIKEIRRIPKEEIKPLGAKHRRKRTKRDQEDTIKEEIVFDPEEGWDRITKAMGIVLKYPSKSEEVEKRKSLFLHTTCQRFIMFDF